MLKIEFDPSDKKLALAIGQALMNYSGLTPFQETERTVTTEDYTRAAGSHTATPEEQPDSDIRDTSEVELDTEGDGTESTAEIPVDKHRVPHNAKLCVGLKADKPFYSSGANEGQWKKGRGVDQAEYDAWYAEALVKARLPETDEAVNETLHPVGTDTAAAFSPETEQSEPSEKPKQHFADAGQFMQWLAENQAAGKVTPAQVEQAYSETGVQMQNLFNPSVAAESIARVYGWLTDNVEALQ